MKILVLNGSPKGKYSITLQTVLYLERKFPEHTFEVLHVGQRIKSLEKDFTEAKRLMEIWASFVQYLKTLLPRLT